jgi:hypothetical protein
LRGCQRLAIMGGLTPIELAPPEQAPPKLTTNEAMFRAFCLPSSLDKDEENEGDEAGEEEEDGVNTKMRLNRTGVSNRTGPAIGSYI